MNMMNLDTRLFTLATCLLVLVISTVPVRSASGVGKESATPGDRIKRRSYLPYSLSPMGNSVSLYDASNTFRAAPYRVPRPYYIPVYGGPGRPLIFYPPQPIYVNPGMPQDNPMIQSFGGQMYLPPKESPHFPMGGDSSLPSKETLPNTESPMGGTGFRLDPDDDDDDAPIWNDNAVVQMQLSADSGRNPGPVPTRAPMATRPKSPPLVHQAQSSGQFNTQSSSQSRPVSPQQQTRPLRPPQRSPSTQRPTTTVPPTASSGPSDCVWAIISCCSASSPATVSQNCFDQRGCPGPFWGASPCESDFARAAIAAAVKYYNGNNSRN